MLHSNSASRSQDSDKEVVRDELQNSLGPEVDGRGIEAVASQQTTNAGSPPTFWNKHRTALLIVATVCVVGGVVGGAIGLDIAGAHWILDERDNPITVGRGVVNACRLMDSTKAGCVRLTNIAYQMLAPELKQFFTARPFVSKEFGAEMGIIAWELQNASRTSRFPHVDEREVVKVCEDIWGRAPDPHAGLRVSDRC